MEFFVNMHNGIHNHYMVDESPYAAEGVNWPVTMAQLASKYCPKGPQGYRLEINSHGSPAQIMLTPEVSFRNLEQFAGLVRRLVRPGGAIEILSCWVAAFPAAAVADELRSANQQAGRSPAGARSLVFGAAPGGSRGTPAPTPPATSLPGTEVRRLAVQAIATRKELLFPKSYTGNRMPALGTSEYNAFVNGPLFCTRLAKLTHTTVRAALIPQLEESEDSGNKWFNTPIGDWEGHVLDFMAGGDVRYAGRNLRRPVFRTHDEHGDGPLRLV